MFITNYRVKAQYIFDSNRRRHNQGSLVADVRLDKQKLDEYLSKDWIEFDGVSDFTQARFPGVDIGFHCVIEDGVKIPRGVSIGDHVIIRKGAVIGKRVRIGSFCEIRSDCEIGDDTSIGSRCTFSAGVKVGQMCVIKFGFVATDTADLNDPKKKTPGSLGDNVKIGANVTLMPGVRVGDGAILGACSQIRKDVGENEVWYGNPGKKV